MPEDPKSSTNLETKTHKTKRTKNASLQTKAHKTKRTPREKLSIVLQELQQNLDTTIQEFKQTPTKHIYNELTTKKNWDKALATLKQQLDIIIQEVKQTPMKAYYNELTAKKNLHKTLASSAAGGVLGWHVGKALYGDDWMRHAGWRH